MEIRVYWKGITKNCGQNPYLKYLKEKVDLVRFRLVLLLETKTCYNYNIKI